MMDRVGTILLIEESRILREASKSVLMSANFEVLTAGDEDEAIRISDESIPDLILLNWAMPKMQGMNILKRLKASPKTRQIPIIMLSGMDGRQNVATTLVSSASEYVPTDAICLTNMVLELHQLMEQTRVAPQLN